LAPGEAELSEGIAAVPLDSLADGTMTVVTVGETEVVVARVGDEVFALDNLCSHAEGWLDMGTLHPETGEIECPMHGGRFDLRTGEATMLPCTQPVASYPVTVVDGVVHVGRPDGSA
jgi:nitrite reductase/ring-hydroxylating ferredoxin subunit